MKHGWLSRNLMLLTVVSLAQDAASDLLYPLLPILLTGIIGAAPLALGLIEGCAEAAAGFTKLYAGKASDRIGRKQFVVAGYSVASLGKVLVVTATAWPLFFVGRVVDRDSVPPEHLGKAFGFHRAGDNLGAVIGPLLALGGLSLLHGDVRKVAMWALIPALISTAFTFFVKDKTRAQIKQEPPKLESGPLPPKLKRAISILVLIQLTNIPDVLLLLRYVLYSGVSVVFAFPAGYLADRFSPHAIYAIGLVAFAVAYFTLGYTGNHTIAFLALAFYGIFPALTDGVGKAWIGGLSEKNQRGKAQGAYQASMNFAVMGAGFWGGAFWTHSVHEWPLMIAAIGAFLGALALIAQNLRNRR
jgi:MFS family permease